MNWIARNVLTIGPIWNFEWLFYASGRAHCQQWSWNNWFRCDWHRIIKQFTRYESRTYTSDSKWRLLYIRWSASIYSNKIKHTFIAYLLYVQNFKVQALLERIFYFKTFLQTHGSFSSELPPLGWHSFFVCQMEKLQRQHRFFARTAFVQ